MSFRLVFEPFVQTDIDEAYTWYENQQPGTGDDFLTAVEEVYDRLRRYPAVHRLVYRNVRRALARQFPYSVYYRIVGRRVEVIAVYHNRRDPSGWQARV